MTKRGAFLAGEPIASLRYEGCGARSFFDDLVAAMREAGCESLPIIEGLRAFVGDELTPRDITKSSYQVDEGQLGL